MLGLGLVFLCAQAVLLNSVFSQPLPCNGNNINKANLGAKGNYNGNPGLGTNFNIGALDNIANVNSFSSVGSIKNPAISNCNNIGLTNIEPTINTCNNIGQAPFTLTSAKFTPVSNTFANQVGLPGPTITEVVPNLQFGDISLTGDLPISGTIKVCGCFPVYGMVAVDGILPTAGTAITQNCCQYPAEIVQKPCLR